MNYYGNSSSVISEWNPGTPLTLYKVIRTGGNTVTTTTRTLTETTTITAGKSYVIATSGGNALQYDLTSSAGTNDGVPALDSDAWLFETSGSYYAVSYTDDSGAKKYLSISTSGVTTTTSSTTTRVYNTRYLRNGSGTTRYLVLSTSEGTAASTTSRTNSEIGRAHV